MTRNVLSVSIVIFVILLPSLLSAKSDRIRLEKKIGEMDQLMKTMTEDVDNAEIAPERNMIAAKKSAEKYANLKRGRAETGALNDVEFKVDEMNQLMKEVIEEVPLAKYESQRNIAVAKKSANKDGAVKRGQDETGVHDDIEHKIYEMNQLMKEANEEVPLAKI